MEERQYYPLSHEQQGLVMLASVFPSPNILYLLSRIDFDSEVDEARLLEAIRLTGERLPYCRVRLHEQDDGTTVQYVSEEVPDPVSVYDLRESPEGELDRLLLEWQQEPFPNEQRDVQLYRFRLLRLPEGKCALHFVVHHFIMDAYAMMYTVRYVDQVYSALTKGTELPPCGPLPWKLLEDENAYVGSAREKRDEAWWRARFETEPRFTSINGLGGEEFVKGRRCGKKQEFEQLFNDILRLRIPAELVRRVTEDAERRHLSPQVYYMLALRSYLGRTNESEDVMVISPVALRSTHVQKHSGLSIAKTVPVRTVFSDTLPFAEALETLAEVENEAYRHARYEYLTLKAWFETKYDVPDDCTYDSVWLTYQPYFELDSSELRFSATLLTSGFVPIPLYLLIQPQDTTGDLYGVYSYALGYTKKESCERFHAFMLKFLETSLAAPEKSLGALIDESL